MAVQTIRDRSLDDTILIDGIRYTTKDDPNKLTNNDFLELMLEELKNQDPTKPKDSSELMNSQLKMSQIESNDSMMKAMRELSASYKLSNLSTAANLIGHIIEDGQENPNGGLNAYQVASVKQENGEVVILANKIVDYDEDTDEYTYEKEFTNIPLENISKIF